MLIDKTNKSWSIEYITTILKSSKGLEKVKDLLDNHKTLCLSSENPFWIFTYQDMLDDDPYQNICKENEVVLSMDFVGYEEEMQVLTYDQLKELVEEVQKILIKAPQRPPEKPKFGRRVFNDLYKPKYKKNKKYFLSR